MEDLLGLLIPLLAVAAWLFGMFRGDDSDSDTQPGRQDRRQPVQRPERAGSEQQKQPAQTSVKETGKQAEGANRYYEKKKEQIDSLKREAGNEKPTTISRSEITMGENRKSIDDRNAGKEKEAVSFSHTGNAISIKDKLTKESLAESVVMAEVLGPPRAVKPYRSVITERKK